MNVTEVPPPSARPREVISSPPLHPVPRPNLLRSVRATFYAEFRPHLPLALGMLAVCGILVALIGLANYLNRNAVSTPSMDNILNSDWVKVLTIAGAPLIGLILGNAQGQRDMKPDVWGFLVHRPVSRGLLFGGRVLAGLALYGLSAGLPLVFLFLYAASPSGGIPFHWRMLLPPLADGIVGLVYYFAGLLLMMREGRLGGSRPLPVLVAIGCSVVVALVPLFSQAMFILLITLSIFALSALGAAQSYGYRLPSTRRSRWATGTILFVGLAMLFLGMSIWLEVKNLEATEAVMRELPADPNAPRVVGAVSNVILPDGTLGIRTYTAPPQDAINKEGVVAYERSWPDKEPVEVSAVETAQKKVRSINEFTLPDTPSYHQFMWIRTDIYPPNPIPASLSTPSPKPPLLPKEQWFYLAPPGVFLGYDYVTHQFLGSIGEDGFASPGRTAQPFGVRIGNAPSDTMTPRGVFSIDLNQRQVTQLRAFPKDTLVLLGSSTAVATATRDQLIIFPSELAATALVLPLAYSPMRYHISLESFPEQGRWAITYSAKSAASPAYAIEIFDHAGTRLTRQEFQSQGHLEWSSDPLEKSWGQMSVVKRSMAWAGIIDAFGVPPASLAVDCYFGGPIFDRPYPTPYTALTATEHQYGPLVHSFLLSSSLTLLVCAAAMFLLARRYGVRFKPFWIVATLLFGPVMLLVLVCLHALPVRTKCAGCGRKVFVQVRDCPHCGAARMLPERNGTEIFV